MVVFSAGYADRGGTHIEVAALVVASLCVVGIEEKLDVD